MQGVGFVRPDDSEMCWCRLPSYRSVTGDADRWVCPCCVIWRISCNLNDYASRSLSDMSARSRVPEFTISVSFYHVLACFFVCTWCASASGTLRAAQKAGLHQRLCFGPFCRWKRISSRGLTTDINARNSINLVAVDVGADPCTIHTAKRPTARRLEGDRVRSWTDPWNDFYSSTRARDNTFKGCRLLLHALSCNTGGVFLLLCYILCKL